MMKKFTRAILILFVLQMITLLCSCGKSASMEQDSSNVKLSYKDSTDRAPMKKKAKDGERKITVQCSKDIQSYVIIKESTSKATYEVHQQLDQTVSYINLKITNDSVGYYYSMSIQKDLKVQKIEWKASVKAFLSFNDVNKDGYVDIETSLVEYNRFSSHNLYVWNSLLNEYKQVVLENTTAEDYIGDYTVYDGYLVNWCDYVVQKYMWNEDKLTKVYEDYSLPDDDEKIYKRKGETFKKISFGKVKFSLPAEYHIVKETKYDISKIYDCVVNKGVNKIPKNFSIIVYESVKMNLSDNTSIMNYFSFYDEVFKKYTARNIKGSSGIKKLYIAEGEKNTYYYIQYKNTAYTVKSDCSGLEKYILQ